MKTAGSGSRWVVSGLRESWAWGYAACAEKDVALQCKEQERQSLLCKALWA